MADLLRSGHTMLNIACPICNNPIFKNKNGEKYCPVCNKKVVIVDNESTSIQKESNKETSAKNINAVAWSSIQEGILKKVEWLINKLKDETQLEHIESYINIISKCYDLYKQLG